MREKRGCNMTGTYIDKWSILQNWEEIRLQVKKGLQRLGHDILLVPKYKEESNKIGGKNGRNKDV